MNEPSEWARPDDRSPEQRRDEPQTAPEQQTPAPPQNQPYPPQYAPQGGQWGPPPGQRPGWRGTIRPGVIPLRPLGLGEVLDGAISFIRSNPKATIGLSAVVAAIAQLPQLAASLVFGVATLPNPEDAARDVDRYLEDVSGLIGPLLASSLLGFLVTSMLTGLLIVVLSQAVLGRRMEIAEAWRAVKGRIPGLLGISILATLGVSAVLFLGLVPAFAAIALDAGPGAILGLLLLGTLAGIAGAIYLGVSWALIGPAYVLEHAGAIASFGRSRRLVAPQWWRVFGTLLLTTVLIAIIGEILALPFSGAALAVSDDPLSGQLSPLGLVLTALGGVIAGAITTPFQAGVTGLIYFDQRMRREGLDITLQRAVGG
ncbi:hypothetical protein [Pseudonocardia thermophila]|jgi:hypothetical protein|uniref:DUF7847 domain-containing protein n=1 Tax=Pseudonocardia thermophila TaxID=1848 RepID=UPI00248E7395|nr:hypothetical protein [Pseudonocardia thermophila]